MNMSKRSQVFPYHLLVILHRGIQEIKRLFFILQIFDRGTSVPSGTKGIFIII